MQQQQQGNNSPNKGPNIIKLLTSPGNVMGGKATIIGTNQQGQPILSVPSQGGNVVAVNKQVVQDASGRQQPTWVLAKSGTQVGARPAGGTQYVVVTQASALRNYQGLTTTLAGTSAQAGGKRLYPICHLCKNILTSLLKR